MNYYNIIQEIANVLREVGFVTVTYGDIDEVDLSRQSLFPLAHVIPETAGVGQTPYTYSFSIVALDMVSGTKEDITEQVDYFHGTDNTQDVHADLHLRLARACEILRRGASAKDGYLLEAGVEITPFKDKFESLCAGWLMPITIQTRNYASSC